MFRQLGKIIILVGILVTVSYAMSERYIIVIDKNRTFTENLAGFPGRCWAKTESKIYLGGGTAELAWLTNLGISYNQIEFDEENTSLYLCYIDFKKASIDPNIVIDEGLNFVLATEPIKQAQFCRRLSLRELPFIDSEIPSDISLTYNSHIDSLIDQVSQDTLIDHLSRLSGQLPVNIGGQLDTIRTRYSGTADIGVAAAYIRQLLEGYGYQTEYHGYYGGSLRHVAVYDANRAWTVAESGEALKTTDGGNTWSVMTTGVTSAMWGVTHVGPDSVWVTGNSGVIRFSSNGGISFTGQSSATGGYLFGSSFINSKQGWIAADSGLVYRTTNAGVNWTRYTTPVTSRYYDVCFVDSLYGWAVGRSGVIARSTNSGISWVRQTSNTTERLYGVDFIDRNNGWVVGWGGVVLHTTNGGTNWQTVNLGTAIEKMHVDFTDSLHGWITGYSGEVFVTSNGGSSWQSINTGFSKDFYGVEFVDSLTGYAVGTGIIAKSGDGGQTWQNQCGTIESAWKNVIATKPGAVNQNQQVIVCGHYDNTSQTPLVLATGADDNGSGTIGVIEAARIMASTSFEKTIKFCLWSGEEQGLYGSAAYAEEAFHRGDSIIGVFNFDMIAYDGNADGSAELHCGTGTASQALGNFFNTAVTDYGINLNPDIIGSGATGASDHASFWDYGYAAFLGIEDYSSDFNPYYHSTNDNMTHISQSFFLNFSRAIIGAASAFAVPVISGSDSVGAITGIVVNEFAEPLHGAIISVNGLSVSDTSDADGEYVLGNLMPGYFRLNCSHPDYRDTFYVGIGVTANNTTEYDVRLNWHCIYLFGDINDDGTIGGADVTFGVRYFRGINGPLDDSCYHDSIAGNGYLYVAGDVNGNCEFRGSDITRLVAYFKSIAGLEYCRYFPPPLRLYKRSNLIR
jgi:photosystem II stability/assembly factor-like uncharacterized protein